MDAIEAIMSRRSIRKFKDTEVPRDIIETLAAAADSAPSACNKRPVDIYFVTDKVKLAALSKSGFFTKMSSPLAVVIAGNTSRTLPRSFGEYWIQDAAAATENLLIAANALGLGACWCGVYLQKKVMDRVAEILDFDSKTIPFSLVRIGYPDEQHEPHEGYSEKRVRFI